MAREFALPGTRPRWAPDRVVDVEHIRLVLDLDPDARRLRGTAYLTVRVIAPATRFVELDAVELEIASVTSGDAALDFRHDGRRLRVDLGDARAAGDQLTLDVAYGGSPRRGLYFIRPDAGYPDKPVQVWTQGQDEDSRYWFPCFDAPHEKATSEVVVTVPRGFFALSNGILIDDRTEGDRRTLHWRLDVPHSCYLVTLVAGRLATIEDRWRDVPVTYHVAPGREADARRTLGRTPEMLELFSRRFGVDYPYPRYAQVFVADFIFGGMENTTATTLTDTVLLDPRAALDSDMEALVSHELAHQWFGDLVTCRDWGEGWLNEGFATYAEYLWREHAEGRDAADLELDEWAEMYFGEDSGRYRRTIATKLYDEPIDIFDHHLYDKGGRVLHMLRGVLGDDAFFASLRHYLTKHRLGVVETRDLARAVDEATGVVVDWFFGQWVIDGAGHPELEVAMAWDPATRRVRTSVEQKQKVEGKTPLFRLPATLRFRVAGADRDVPVEIVDQQHTFFVPLDDEPSQMIFDPGRTLLASIKLDKPEAVWAAELAGATLAIDRSYAAKALSRRGGPRAAAAIEAALTGDPFWAVRGAAAAGLGAMRTERARGALIAAIGEAHPRARRAVVRALGDFVHDDGAAEVLAGVVGRGDPSYFVEAEACLALGRTRSPRAAELLARAAERESFGDVIRSHAWRGLAAARADAEVPRLVGGTGWGRPSQGRRAAAGALAELVRGRRDQAARDVRERLEELLADPDFRVQAAAIEALAKVGDPASVAPLQRVVERELDGRLRRRAREVVRDLEEGAAATGDLRALRDELDGLRRAVGALRERLDRQEASAGNGAGPAAGGTARTPARGKAAARAPRRPATTVKKAPRTRR
jgi:aminopeptidase N